MPTKFLYPDNTQDKVMEELEKLVKVLEIPSNPELKKNIRFMRNLTKSLFIVAHKKQRAIKKELSFEPYNPINIQEYNPAPIKTPEMRKIPSPPPPAPKASQLPIPTLTHPEIESNNIIQLKKENGTLVYDVVEPRMESIDWRIYNALRPIVKEAVKKDPNIVENQNFIDNEIKKISKTLKIKYSPDYVKKIKYYLEKNIKGYGKIDPLMRDLRVRKIICSSYDNIKVIFENETLPTNIEFDSNEELNNFIFGLAEKYNQKLSESQQSLEIKLPNMEIKAEYSPLTTSSFTITKIA